MTYNSITHNSNITNTDYSMSVSRQGNNNTRYTRYTFTGGTGQPIVDFEFLNSTPYIRYRINGGSWINPTNQVVSNSGNNRTVVFDPVTIYSQSGGITLTIDRLVRDSRQNRDTNEYQSTSFARVYVTGSIPTYGNI